MEPSTWSTRSSGARATCPCTTFWTASASSRRGRDAAAHAGADPTIWISCGSGFRATVGASLLARAGIPVVAVDDHFHKAAAAGLPIGRDDHAVMLGDAYADQPPTVTPPAPQT